MKTAICKLIFKISGWKAINNVSHLKQCIVVGAPHTSNWDGLFAPAGVWAMGINFKFLVKKDLFIFPFNLLMKAFGALPVDRAKKTDLTTQAANYFKEHENLVLGITPEGTRSANPNWKKGFYYIAQKANVPIVFGYADYAKKVICMDRIFEPSGDIEADMKIIKAYFKNITPKHPEKFAI